MKSALQVALILGGIAVGALLIFAGIAWEIVKVIIFFKLVFG